ncbi:MAG: TonB-dependent receptor [Gemmatimonas sp.]|nr:TonB-dependent receptor [Gemmatimonas sp.]
MGNGDPHEPRGGAIRFDSRQTRGIVVSGSASRRDFTASVLDPDSYEEVDGNILPNELELQVEDNERERYGVSTNLDWRPNPETGLYLRGLYTRTQEIAANSEFEITFEGDLEMQSAMVGRYSAGSVELDLSEGDERESLYAFTLGGERTLGAGVTWDAAATFTRGMLDDEGPDVTFETPAEEEDRASTVFDVEPYFFTVEPEDPAYIGDPSNYPLRSASWSLQSNREDTWVASTNLRLNTRLADFPAYLKFGGKLQRRDKVIDDQSFRYVPKGITLAPYALPAAGTVQGGSEAFLHGDVTAFSSFFAENRSDPALFELDEAETAFQAVDNDSDNLETISAGYVMGNVDIGRLSLLAGVRVEQTATESRRYEVFEDEETGGIDVSDRMFDNAYTTILPSAVLKFEPANDMILRAAWTNTIGRPDYEELAGFRRVRYRPTAVVDVFEGTVTEGNPELKPYEASNLDASIEYYFQAGGMLSAGGFYKRIDNPIYDFRLDQRDVTFEGRQFAELVITQDRNSDAGTLTGMEVSWVQPLIFLPYPFDGLGITANAALIDSSVQVPGRDEKLPFFGQSGRIYNLVPYYQRGPVELRFAWTYRGEYLDQVGEEAFLDRYGDARPTIDLSARYQLPMDGIEVFAQVRNLTNEPEVGYQGVRSRYDVHTLTGRTLTLGLSLNY